MADAFLHRRSVFDKHKDAYGFKNPIKQMRVARSWDNPITRHKREKSLHDWANSFAGKRHYRKLSRHNAIHLHEDSMNRVPIEEICDALNRYATARWLPFKADLLHGTDEKHISLHGGHVYLDIGYAPSGELEVYDAEAARPLNVLTHWDSVDEIAGHLLGLAVRQAAKNESVYEKLRFEKGHKDSKGNDAPWVIRSHEDGKVLASFANKDDAVQHLARMKNYSKKESVMKNWSVNVLWRSPAGFERTTRVLVRADSKEAAGREAEKYVRREVGSVDTVAHDIKEYVEESCSLRETLRESRLRRLREDSTTPKTCVLAYKTADDTYYCKNRHGDWTTHIEDAWEGSSPESFSGEMKCNFADVVGAPESDLEVMTIEKFENKDEGSDIRTLIAAAAKSAWSSSGASDFKLDITKLDDCVRIRAMGPKGEDNIGIWWVVSPDEDTVTMSIDQYAEWGEKPYEQEPERSWTVEDYDSLEDSFEDEFEALQETIDAGKGN